MLRLLPILLVPLAISPARADQVTVSGGSVYVTREDCARLVQHRPAPDATYRPGVDVHGKYVAPADLPEGAGNGLPDRVRFDVVINPLTFAQQNAGAATGAGKYANTQLPVGRVEVDMKTGEATFNGRPLTDPQNQTLREACRKAHP
jgi:hypothetical protein